VERISDFLPGVSHGMAIIPRISVKCLFAGLAQLFLQAIACFHNRPIHEVGWRISPLRIVRIKSYNVPQNSSAAATMKLYVCWQLLIQFLCNHVIFVPELRHPGIVNSRSHPAIGARPIHWQNGFPDHEHVEMVGRIPSKQVFDCGGPPQTHGSRWRQQQHGTGSVCIPVKGHSKLVEVAWVQ
jgi:hypothetical protein